MKELEQLNLKGEGEQREDRGAAQIQEERIKYLTDEEAHKAVNVLVSDLEGRLPPAGLRTRISS